MHLVAAGWTTGDALALGAIIVTLLGIGVGVVGGLWKVSQLLGSMVARLDDHSRRLEVIETASVEGPVAGWKRRRELADDHAGVEDQNVEGPGAVREMRGTDHARGDAPRRHGTTAGAGHV